mgnify:CR=1 FL=1
MFKETESKRMEASLRKSEEKFRTMYDSIKDGIIYTDIDGNILDANQAYLDMLRAIYNRRTKKAHLPEVDAFKVAQNGGEYSRDQIKVKGYSDEYKKEYIRENGSIFPVSIRMWLISDDQGKLYGMWGISGIPKSTKKWRRRSR